MSDNKFKYFTVTSTKVVKALNKRDAMLAASRASRVPDTSVMWTVQDAERISASRAHSMSTS